MCTKALIFCFSLNKLIPNRQDDAHFLFLVLGFSSLLNYFFFMFSDLRNITNVLEESNWFIIVLASALPVVSTHTSEFSCGHLHFSGFDKCLQMLPQQDLPFQVHFFLCLSPISHHHCVTASAGSLMV